MTGATDGFRARVSRCRGVAGGVLGLLILLAGGCAAGSAPIVAVGKATLVETTPDAIRFDIELELENPGLDPLELREVAYHVTLNGETLPPMRRAAETTLASGRVRRLVLPAVAGRDRERGWGAETAWSVRGALVYIAPGALAEALLDTGVRTPRVRFSGRGIVRLDATSAATATPR